MNTIDAGDVMNKEGISNETCAVCFRKGVTVMETRFKGVKSIPAIMDQITAREHYESAKQAFYIMPAMIIDVIEMTVKKGYCGQTVEIVMIFIAQNGTVDVEMQTATVKDLV